jgi:hypothetical protein
VLTLLDFILASRLLRGVGLYRRHDRSLGLVAGCGNVCDSHVPHFCDVDSGNNRESRPRAILGFTGEIPLFNFLS